MADFLVRSVDGAGRSGSAIGILVNGATRFNPGFSFRSPLLDALSGGGPPMPGMSLTIIKDR